MIKTGEALNAIELYNVSLPADDAMILENISFTIREGELHCIMGTSGSGKSTLLKVINGLLLGIEGEVIANGKNIYKFTPAQMLEYHTRCGFIFQNAALISNMTVLENLALGFQFHQEMSLKEVRALVKPHLDYFEIDENLLNQRPATLSAGEKMLISIVRAIAKKPEFIFWDQPLASLDYIHQKKLIRLIKEYKDEGRTMMLVTNHAEIALNYADQVGILEKGRLIASNTPKALKRSRNRSIKMLLQD